MGLTEELNELKQQLGKEIPKETLKEIGRFVQGLARSEIEKKSCGTGDRMPSFTLPNVTGRMVSSGDILAEGPMVLSFYRGGW